jgi:anti-sigma B factor antagonist
LGTPGFSVETARHDTTVVVGVRGEIDIATGPSVWETVEDVMGQGDTLVLDLAATTFMDSTGLGLIIRASSVFGPDRVVVRSPQPRVLALFDLTGMRKHITIEDDIGGT